MLLKPELRSWRTFVALLPAAFLVSLEILSLFFFDWQRLMDSGGIFIYLALTFTFTMVALFPFFLLMGESWEILGDQLVHHFFYSRKTFAVADIESFTASMLWSGLPSLFFSEIRPMYLTVKGRKVDGCYVPYLYSVRDWESFKAELKNCNPSISFIPKLV